MEIQEVFFITQLQDYISKFALLVELRNWVIHPRSVPSALEEVYPLDLSGFSFDSLVPEIHVCEKTGIAFK